MKNYRIVREETIDGGGKFIIQKRWLGFLWWYDIAYGIRFDTLEGARECLRVVYNKTKRIIVEEL